MKPCTVIATLSAVAFATPTPDECVQKCNSDMDRCVVGGNAIASCTTTYIGCLGYNPYDEVPYKKPTTCRKAATGDSCADKCNNSMDKCVSGGHAISTCTTTYIGCLGYSPYDEVPFMKPTACRKTLAVRDACARNCNSAMDKCVAGGNDIASCTGTYTECLGFNPYDVVPYKKPTTCRK
ncbi:cyclin dependent kinase (Pho85) [Purpureocillium lavendulum]|uniref:Cyclin dependent kinase (Pho85) n=1 Tax=Purpureocillium lavendulum TaxID=1247861 RepID=A0AB34FN87_9HYPO|nr:cyclin dependent kinase (Pho85) [Purpureocillium lavendulum]